MANYMTFNAAENNYLEIVNDMAIFEILDKKIIKLYYDIICVAH